MSPCCKEAETRGVGIGMAIAAGIIAEWDDVRATEILQAAGFHSFNDLREAGVDDYDIKLLRRVVTEMMAQRRRISVKLGRGFVAVDRLAA